MAIDAYWYSWGWAYNDASESLRVSFSPQYGYAATSLSNVYGGGLTAVGITHYETRPQANGPNVPTDFGWNDYFGYPPAIDANDLTEVTAEVDVGGDQGATGLLTVYLWG